MDEALTVWARAISDLDDTQIATGLEYCSKNHTWPPSVAEFRDACKSGSDWRTHEGPKLPKPKPDPGKVKAGIKSLRGAINGR